MNSGYSAASVSGSDSAAGITGLRAGGKVQDPFLTLLCGFYWLFPALWAVGLAPFAPFVFVAIGGFTALLADRRIRFFRYELLGIGLLLAGASVGLLSIGKADRILTWSHDVTVIVAMMLIVNAVRRVRNPNRIRQIDKALLVFIAFVVIVGLAGLVIPGHIRYNTPVMDLLPKSLSWNRLRQVTVQCRLVHTRLVCAHYMAAYKRCFDVCYVASCDVVCLDRLHGR